MYLTRRQREILTFIEDFIREKRYSPSLEEIGQGVGLSSLATVHVHLRNLEGKKLIRRAWNHSRSIELTSRGRGRRSRIEIPLLGRVAAGEPIEAIEVPETIEVPREFIRGKETFVLQIEGESMIDDQIRDGDLIIVERRQTARRGETVVALIDDKEATVKKFYPERGNKVRLQPANEKMKAIVVPADSVTIQGVVVGLLRRY